MKIGDIQLQRNARIKPRFAASGPVGYVPTVKLQSSIKWRGIVRLHQTGNDEPSYLSDHEYPPKSGRIYYADASTGLLFDKETGACKQSSRVTLKLDTLVPVKCTAATFRNFIKDKIESGPRDISIGKRGPKPKGYVAPDQEEDCDE